jgi:hypothetical protein
MSAGYTPARRACRERTSAALRAGKGYVYVAEIEGTTDIKVGFSLDPKRRVRELTRNSRRHCYRVLVAWKGTWSDERRLHTSLRAHQLPEKAYCAREHYPRSILVKDADGQFSLMARAAA